MKNQDQNRKETKTEAKSLIIEESIVLPSFEE